METKRMHWPETLNRLATGIVEEVMYHDGVSNVYTYDFNKNSVMRHYLQHGSTKKTHNLPTQTLNTRFRVRK